MCRVIATYPGTKMARITAIDQERGRDPGQPGRGVGGRDDPGRHGQGRDAGQDEEQDGRNAKPVAGQRPDDRAVPGGARRVLGNSSDLQVSGSNGVCGAYLRWDSRALSAVAWSWVISSCSGRRQQPDRLTRGCGPARR